MEVQVPVSLGELYDKISILLIKTKKIFDETKLKNILHELAELQKIAEKYPIELQYTDALYYINESLWEVEDKLRVKEKNKIFDEGFIALARSVYYHNDKRSVIKREINEKYGSSVIEEKSYEKYE